MRLSLHRSDGDRDYLEPAPSPLLPVSCLLAILIACAVVGVQLGARMALIAIAFAVVSLTTRLPRVLPVVAALCLLVAALAVVVEPTGSGVAAAHVLHAVRRR